MAMCEEKIIAWCCVAGYFWYDDILRSVSQTGVCKSLNIRGSNRWVTYKLFVIWFVLQSFYPNRDEIYIIHPPCVAWYMRHLMTNRSLLCLNRSSMSCTVKWAPPSSFVRSVLRTTKTSRLNLAVTLCALPVLRPGRYEPYCINSIYLKSKLWAEYISGFGWLLLPIQMYMGHCGLIPVSVHLHHQCVSFLSLCAILCQFCCQTANLTWKIWTLLTLQHREQCIFLDLYVGVYLV